MREETEFVRVQCNCPEIRNEFRVQKLGFTDGQPADFVRAHVRKLINIHVFLAIFV